MSDEWDQIPEGTQDGAEAEAGPDEATGAEASQEPEVQYLEIDDDLAARHVRLTVDGEELSVPLSELTQGYSRQADYTRKTQELANQRKEAEAALQLQRAFEANPGLTVQILAERQGMSVQQFLGLSQQQQNAAAQQAAQEDEYTDPLEQQLAESNRRLQTLEQQIAQERADRELRETITGLKQQYQASDDDIRAVVQQAMQLNLPPQMLPMLYQATAFQKLSTQQQTRQEAETQRAAQEQARRQAAAAAGGVVGSGQGATGTTTAIAGTDGRMSLSDAISSALEGFPD